MIKPIQLITSLICFVLGGASVHAALSYWDSNGTTPGAGATPTGNWGTDNFWSTDSSGSVSTTTWTPGNTAVFSAGTDAVNPFTVTVSGNQTAGGMTFEEGAVTLSGGTLTMGTSPFPMVVTASATINSILAGTALTKTGTGTLTLNGANTYTELTTISAGVIAVGNANALGNSVTTNTTISAGAALQISGGIALADTLAMFGTGVAGDGAVRNISGSNAVDFIQLDPAVSKSGRINVDAGTLFVRQMNAGNKFTLTFGGNGDTIISPSPAVVNVDGLFWGGEPGNVVKEGGGTLTLNGQCNIRGTFTVSAGTARWGASTRFGNAGGINPDLSVTGTFDLNGFSENVDGLIGAGSVINAGASALTICAGSGSSTHAASPNFTGVISGGTTLQKEGATRTQTLSGTNTYTGGTIINAGTLKLGAAGSISNTPTITVNSNATFDVSSVSGGYVLGAAQTLTGNGTVLGNVTAKGVISPGAPVGTLAFTGNLTLAGNLAIDVDKSLSPSNDVIMVTGTLNNTGTGTVTVTNLNPGLPLAAGNSFKLFNQAVVNGGALTVVSAGGGVVWNNQLAVNGSIIVVSVTTPSVVTNPQITSIVGAGTTSVTVNYTNTLPGTNYVLRYNTNLNATNWYDVGTKPAAGTSDFQNDSPPAGDPQRYYRVYYVTP